MELNQRNCEACRPDAPHVTEDQMAEWMLALPGWEVIQVDGVNQLQKTFHFTRYAESLAFVNAVAGVSEEEAHHPVMLFEFRQVTVRWWSHKMGGLHVNDFVMAAKTEGFAK